LERNVIHKVRNIHLAAYMQVHGCKLVEVQGRVFLMESDRTLDSWKIEHANSCCRKVDLALLELRRINA
jgi:hypothetical protein